MAEHYVFALVERDAIASAVRTGRLKFASWERWRPAGVFRSEAFPHPLAGETSALPGPAIRFHPKNGTGDSLKLRSNETGCILVFAQSRSDPAMVAVAFKPRSQGQPGDRRGAMVEINANKRFKRRSATPPWGKPFPWAEAHGYHPGLAPRGPDTFSKIEMPQQKQPFTSCT
jgi:hypothetical protein